MVDVNWPKAYAFMQADELGKDDDPVDPGGRTCDGVEQRELNAWCDIHKQAHYDVWNIDEATKQSIFYVQYWHPWCARLPAAIDYLWFDVNVNSGVHEATLILQRAMGMSPYDIDGRMGLVTCQTALAFADKAALIEKFCDQHQLFFRQVVREKPVMLKFIDGWTSRVKHERTNAHALLASAGP